MNTDKWGLHKSNCGTKTVGAGPCACPGAATGGRPYKVLVFLSAFICACFAGLCLTSLSFAATPTTENAFDAAAKALDKSKEEVQKLKDVWDKTRLETTLYDQRAKRAYKRWTKAAKAAREKAEEQKEKAQLELQLAIEKRKLAYNLWQEAVLRETAEELKLKVLDQQKDTAAIREKIKQLEDKIGRQPSALSPQPSAKTYGN